MRSLELALRVFVDTMDVGSISIGGMGLIFSRPQYDNKMRLSSTTMQCLENSAGNTTRFPLHILLYAEYSVKLNIYLFTSKSYLVI